MWDFPEHRPLTELVERHARSAVIAAVCHGPAGLLAAMRDEEPLLQGRTVTAFSDAEETLAGASGAVPFSLERVLRELGCAYTAGPAFKPHAVRDGNLITGQNPASSAACAALVVGALRERAEQLVT